MIRVGASVAVEYRRVSIRIQHLDPVSDEADRA